MEAIVTGNVTGVTSGASRGILFADDESTFTDMFEDIADNKRLQEESDLIIDFTESNPFGEI